MEKKKNSELFSAILYIIIGVLLIVFRAETIGWAMTIAGIFFIVSGILDAIKKNWSSGAISLIIGIAILVLGWAFQQIVFLVLGILIAIKGVIALIEIIKRGPTNALELVFPVLSIVIGALLIFAFGDIINIILIICGSLLAVDGVIGLVGALKK